MRLKGEGSLAHWDAIAVVEEFSLVDTELQEGTDPHLIAPNEKLWGDSYFFDEPSSEFLDLKHISKVRPRNYFLLEIEKVTRYAVAFIKNIDRLVQEDPVTIDKDKPAKDILKTMGLCHSSQPKVAEGRYPEMQRAKAEESGDDGLQMPGEMGPPSPSRSQSNDREGPEYNKIKEEMAQSLIQ